MSDPQILEGDLNSFDLPQVLKTLALRKVTGILTVQGEDDIVAISCLNGHIVTADSLNQTQEESLGELLVSQGLVTKSDYDAVVMEHQGSGGSVGELLVSRALITREKLLECLRLQTYRLMLQVLVWRVGEFKFYGGDEVSYEKGVTPISIEELLMRALADLGDQSSVGGEVPKLDAIYRPVPPRGVIKVLGRDGTGEPEAGAPGIWITDVQMAFLERMDSNTSAFDIARSLGTGRFRTLFSLHQLIQNDLVEIEAMGVATAGVGTATPRPGGMPPQTVPSQTVPPQTVPPQTVPPQTVPPQTAVPPQSVAPQSSPQMVASPGGRAVSDPSGTLALSPSSPSLAPPHQVASADRPATAARVQTASSRRDLADDRTVVSVPINPRPWVGVGLGAILVVALLSAFVERPTSYLFPFPWQAEQRREAEQQMRETLFSKIDGAIGAYYLMDFQYPRNLEALVGRGLLTASDLLDPVGGVLKYSSAEDGYRLGVVEAGAEGEPVEERIRSIQGDVLRDLDRFKPDLMKSPLELLD